MAGLAEFDADSRTWLLHTPATAVAYHHDDELVVLAWRALPRHGQPQPPLRLAGAEPDAVYVDVLTGARHHGAVLRHHGLNVPLPDGDHASAMVHLRIDPAPPIV
jgi:alpha-galactosidase